MKIAIHILFLIWFSTSSFSQVNFTTTNSGTTQEMNDAIDYTTSIWSTYLESNVPITINVIYTDLGGSGPLAVIFLNGIKDFGSAPPLDIWCPTSLVNSIEGNVLNPASMTWIFM